MSPKRRLLYIATVLLAVIGAGTVGYMVIEGWSFMDALFMAITTISTVGYREVQPLSDSGRVFTLFLIVGEMVSHFRVQPHRYYRLKISTKFAVLDIVHCGPPLPTIGRTHSKSSPPYY
jgi:Ion channel